VGFHPRKLPFAEAGVAEHQGFGDEEAQDGITQEFKLLVIVERRTAAHPQLVGQ
jgi:hypothetical protein